MKSLQSLFFGTTIAAATATLATIAASPVQAFSLNASMTLTGTADYSNQGSNKSTVEFIDASIENQHNDFSDIVDTDLTIDIFSVDKTNGLQEATFNDYTFINFGEQTIDGITDELTFNLDENGDYQVRSFFMGLTTSVVSDPLEKWQGTFNFGEEELDGTLQFTSSKSGNAGSFNMTLKVTEEQKRVPEPSTLLGLGAVVGAGVLSRKKALANRQEK